MSTERYGHDRQFVTQRVYDSQRGEYVDQELPTITIKFLGAERRGQYVQSQQGTDASGPLLGSYRVTGSHYDLAPGTYSLRITRLNIGVSANLSQGRVGTPDFGFGTTYSWMARHSRDGTLMILQFPAPAQVNMRGKWDDPIMAMGPGTFIYGHLGDRFNQVGSKVDLSQNLEGILG